MTPGEPVRAAGAVVLRRGRREVLLVHRPKYDDWTFPKGKLEPGESVRAAAVREVEEETGVRVRLGPPLTGHSYTVGQGRDLGREKVVHWWVGRAVGDGDGGVSSYAANDEVDAVRWVPADEAGHLLTYDRDGALLAEARRLPRTRTLLVVRHGHAFPRKEWDGDDRERPLAEAGRRQAEGLGWLLRAYGVTRLVSSSSRRCWTTLQPYAVAAGLDIEETDALSEQDATRARVATEVEDVLGDRGATALCTHRPVLPLVFDALGIDPGRLEPGASVVVHHRAGARVALERIAPVPD